MDITTPENSESLPPPTDKLLESLSESENNAQSSPSTSTNLDQTTANKQRADQDEKRNPFSLYLLAILLFILTFISTTVVSSDFLPWLMHPDAAYKTAYLKQYGFWSLFFSGFTYSIPVMSILLAHELGHYVQFRRYGVPTTPPLFIPLPIPPIGTLGAVIATSSNVPNRRALFDIAVSGPLAGLCVAIPLMFYALSNAHYEYVPPGQLVMGDPPVFRMVAEWLKGPIPPGKEIIVDGIGMAVWVGLLVTGLNLIPVGQLDGGHILYCLIGRRAHDVALFITIFVGAYMLFTLDIQFLLMFLLMLRVGIYHPPTRNETIKLGWFRTILGWLTLMFLFIGFTTEPFQQKKGPDYKSPNAQQRFVQQSANPSQITESTSCSFSPDTHFDGVLH